MTTASTATLQCAHCLLPVAEKEAVVLDTLSGPLAFCCHACRAIYRMVQEEGLGEFYRKRDWTSAGIPDSLKTDPVGPAGGDDALSPFIRGEGTVREADLLIEGIRCASCVWLNERVLERTPGILSARVNFATHRAVVRWDANILSLGKVLARIRSVGYVARTYSPGSLDASLKRENRDILVRFGTAAFFSMQLMLLSFGLYAGFYQGIDSGSKQWLEYAAFLVCTPVLFYSGLPFLQGAVRGIGNRTLNMDVLVALGALSAYLLSVSRMLTGGEVFFDTAAMIITLVLLGRLLENNARSRASDAVVRLLALRPRNVRVLRGRERVVLPSEAVRKGDLIEVRPGEHVALDGMVREGQTEIDESLVTGESRPVEKIPGSEVIGGSLNGLGTIVVEVTRIGGDTVLSRIAQLVERAQARTAKVQRAADRVSAYFIPLVVLAAGLAFWFWQRSVSLDRALLNAVSVLVIACPCALGLATPVAIVAAVGSAARKGILVRGGDVLERLQRVDSVVLDKTGTVTTGKMRVVEVRSRRQGRDGQASREDLLRFAASAEQGSEHLLGSAIVRHAAELGLTLFPAGTSKAVPGQGTEAWVKGAQVLVGRKAFLESFGISIDMTEADRADCLEREGRTVVWTAKGGELLGTIDLMDEPREESARVVRRLHGLGMDVTMVTGDNAGTAAAIAARTNISSVVAGVKPDGKVEQVERMMSNGRVVAMAGDGINDAPALAAADVGIAMAGGADIAMESADVVLLRADLEAVVHAIEFSRKAFRIIRQNLFWAFVYNIAALPLAMAGMLSPIVAAGAMAASSIAVVGNSLRLR